MKTMKVVFGAFVGNLPDAPEGVDVKVTANVTPPWGGNYDNPPESQETEILSAIVETEGKWCGQDLMQLPNWEEWLNVESIDDLAWAAYEERWDMEIGKMEEAQERAHEVAMELLAEREE